MDVPKQSHKKDIIVQLDLKIWPSVFEFCLSVIQYLKYLSIISDSVGIFSQADKSFNNIKNN